MKHKTCFFLLIIALITSCSANNRQEEATDIHFKKGTIDISESFDFRFVRLETNEDCLLAHIRRIEVYDDRIFIEHYHENNTSLHVFDINGKFITKVGNKGGAPHEYYELAHFAIDKENKTIIISDTRKRVLMYFDSDSYEYLYSKEFQLGYSDFFVSKNRYYFFSHKGFHESRNDHYVMTTDTALNIIFEDLECKFKTYLISRANGSIFYEHQNQAFVYHSLYPFVYKINDNNCELHSTLSFEGFRFPSLGEDDEPKTASGRVDTRYLDNLEKSSVDINAYAVFETKDIIYIPLIVGRSMYFALYIKATKESYIMNHIEYFNSTGINAFLNLAGVADDEIVGYLSIYPEIYNDKDKITNENFYSILDSISMDDNPVLCFMKWKK